MSQEPEPTHLAPQSSTPTHSVEGEDTQFEEIDSDTDEGDEPIAEYLQVSQTLPSYTTGGHEHVWVETNEGRDDDMMTAICTYCGAGMHYHKSVHSVTDGKLNTHV